MNSLEDLYRGRNVLITGHTGFKGSWLALWLSTLGAKVSGLALGPSTKPNHWDQLNLSIAESRVDIRDAALVSNAVHSRRPEIVFHLAAQALVRRSYVDPLETWATNVMGTANLLEACRSVSSVKAIVVVTTDKCYENRDWPWGYREVDALGGHDPYSASKAATELLASNYRRAFFSADGLLLATARAGNVIGGGDWSKDRLLPDVARAVMSRQAVSVRFPNAIRPWQHVLDSLYGYLLLGGRLLCGDFAFADAWNFGPDTAQASTVGQLLNALQEHWPELRWHCPDEVHPHEARQLQLDSSKARTALGWRPRWNLVSSIQATAEWYRHFLTTGESVSKAQLDRYLSSIPG